MTLAHSECFLSLNKSLDSVVHVLGKLNFIAAESAKVGNVEDTVIGFGVLSMGASNLNVVFGSD
jgi:hypothetical protein